MSNLRPAAIESKDSVPDPEIKRQASRSAAAHDAELVRRFNEGDESAFVEIVEGIENDSLFDVMKEHIEEGRALFKSRVTAEIYQLNLYDRAIVDVMIKSKGHVKSKIW